MNYHEVFVKGWLMTGKSGSDFEVNVHIGCNKLCGDTVQCPETIIQWHYICVLSAELPYNTTNNFYVTQRWSVLHSE